MIIGVVSDAEAVGDFCGVIVVGFCTFLFWVWAWNYRAKESRKRKKGNSVVSESEHWRN